MFESALGHHYPSYLPNKEKTFLGEGNTSKLRSRKTRNTIHNLQAGRDVTRIQKKWEFKVIEKSERRNMD